MSFVFGEIPQLDELEYSEIPGDSELRLFSALNTSRQRFEWIQMFIGLHFELVWF